jgi:hypothetical protein
MEPKSITLEVVTPERQVIRETATEIQVPGKAGYLGILPGHAPLLTELGIGVLSYSNGGEKRSATICGGFGSARRNACTATNPRRIGTAPARRCDGHWYASKSLPRAARRARQASTNPDRNARGFLRNAAPFQR